MLSCGIFLAISIDKYPVPEPISIKIPFFILCATSRAISNSALLKTLFTMAL